MANVEREFSAFTHLLTKLQNALAPKSLDKLMQLVSLESHIDGLDCGKITDVDKFLKK